MATILMVGDCRPLDPANIMSAGHQMIPLRTADETWDWLQPEQAEGRDVGAAVVIIGADVSNEERAALIRWIEEETPLLPVLVLAQRDAPHPAVYADYAADDSSDEAFRVIVKLLNGIDRNC